MFPVVARSRLFGRIYNLLRSEFHKRRYGIDTPLIFHAVELEINSMCNRKCPYSVSKRPAGYMDLSIFQKIIQELAEVDFDGRVSYHFYGEPLLEKRLPEIVEFTKLHIPKCKPQVYSNGDFLTLEAFRHFTDKGVDKFVVVEHDNSVPGNLSNLLKNITEEEKRHLDFDYFKNLYPTNRAGILTHLKKIDNPLKLAFDRPLGIMVVTMTGNVVLCCNDYFESEILGNVNEKSLREIWTSKRFSELRKALSSGDRTKCDICMPCDYVPADYDLQRIVPIR